MTVFEVFLIPFLGTCLGAACVYFVRNELSHNVQRVLIGFAAGVMMAASIWSLLIPAMEESAYLGKLAFLPAVIGFWLGTLFLLFLDYIIPHLHLLADKPEGPKSKMPAHYMMLLAVALHNIPEGMAVGVVLANWLTGNATITWSGVVALAIGIAIQNFPEGAIISLPLKSVGMSRNKAFLAGAASGIVEPIGALFTVWLTNYVLPFLPYLLAASAGAMIYVVVEELIPEMSAGEHSNIGVIAFGMGFTLMMVLDVALG